MRIRQPFAFLVLAVLPALGQQNAQQSPQQKTLPFAVTLGDQPRNEMLAVIRGVSDTSPAMDSGGIKIQGTADQIALAEWLMQSLDRAPDGAAPQAPNLVSGEFRLAGGGDHLVRLLYLPWAKSNQELAEVSTIIRSMSDARRLFTYQPLNAMVMRGTDEQVAMADWLAGQLSPAAPRIPEFRLRGTGDSAVRVLDARFTRTPQGMAEASTLVRAVTDIRRVFTFNAGLMVTVRGTDEQVALAQWIFRQLAAKANDRSVPFSSAIADSPGIVRSGAAVEDRLTLFFPAVTAGDELTKLVADIKNEVQLKRVYAYSASHAVAVRGTAEQLATVDRLLIGRGY